MNTEKDISMVLSRNSNLKGDIALSFDAAV